MNETRVVDQFSEEKKERCEKKVIVQISDIHIRSSIDTKVNNKEEVWELFSFIHSFYKEWEDKPIIIMSGDQIDAFPSIPFLIKPNQLRRLMSTQMEFFMECVNKMEDLGYTIFICPGNHDYYPKLGGFKKLENMDFAEKMIKAVNRVETVEFPIKKVHNDIVFIIVDSMEGEPKGEFFYFTGDGTIGQRQRKKIGEIIEECHGKDIVIFFHHSPVTTKYILYFLNDSKYLFEEIKKHKNSKNRILMFSGHLHFGPYVYKFKDYGIDRVYEMRSSTHSYPNFVKQKPGMPKNTLEFLEVELTEKKGKDDGIIENYYTAIKKSKKKEFDEEYVPSLCENSGLGTKKPKFATSILAMFKDKIPEKLK